MFKLFNKGRLTALLAILSLITVSPSLSAWDDNCCDPCSDPCCNTGRLYIGGFGGGIWTDSASIEQLGTAFFPYDPPTFTTGGPLAVIAQGHTKSSSTGFGGAQVGYEWLKPWGCDWTLGTAGELEAYYFQHKNSGTHLINHTLRGLPEHDFVDSFKLNRTVILANVVFSLTSCCMQGFTPYVGGGIGAAYLSLRNADSFQVEPVEAGINHFNSRRSDSTWAFAAQAKAGIRYNFCECFHIFAEYRYLYIDNGNFILGSTNYTTHVPTSAWNVRIKSVNHNAFAVGLQFDL